MRIMITGATGMLGQTLQQYLSDHELIAVGSKDFNLTDARATTHAVVEAKPDVIVHSAAYTKVDNCETEQDLAFAVNTTGSANIASAAHRVGARLMAISTDYVFDGQADNPYNEYDKTAPRTVYGKSKYAGEQAIRHSCPDHLILRVAWLYGANGPSFLHTMLRLGAQEGAPLKVVDDQHGNPTSTDAVAQKIKQLLDIPTVGTLHLTCEGETTWFGFTKAIFAAKDLQRGAIPCTTDEYPRPAPRPKNSRLDNLALRSLGLDPMPHWQEAMETFLKNS